MGNLLVTLMIYNSTSAAGYQFSKIGELAPDDFRISRMGPDGIFNYSGRYPAAAYNSSRDHYLVAIHANPGTEPLSEIKQEIFGQFFTSQPPDLLPVIMK